MEPPPIPSGNQDFAVSNRVNHLPLAMISLRPIVVSWIIFMTVLPA